ncbi:unnamed protein product [Angiostrongylus costaricensis]|uniref:AAA domain-containing protein n=1 Tax=Angiostrongylus costaricensis TaxID=334426 RepID=A0A158PK63_ANGCS|nr:unnamed protein product [Angiostrongylus costaricensis]
MNSDSEFGDGLFIAEDEAEEFRESRSPEESSALGVEPEKGYPKSVPKDSKRTKSRLPSSLKTNIIRSRAKVHELEASGSNITSKQRLPRRPPIVRFSRKDNQAQVELTTENELASDKEIQNEGPTVRRWYERRDGWIVDKHLTGKSNANNNTGSSKDILAGLDFSKHNVVESRKRRAEGRKRDKETRKRVKSTTSLTFQLEIEHSQVENIEQRCTDESVTTYVLDVPTLEKKLESRCLAAIYSYYDFNGDFRQSLLREGNSNLKRFPRKKRALHASIHKEIQPTHSEDINSVFYGHVDNVEAMNFLIQNNVETFDTFLKYPMDVLYPQTVEGFCTTSAHQENCFYENYRANVRGEGVVRSDLEDEVKKRIANTEKEIAKWSSLATKLEEQDYLGTDPFIDYIAYRFHPLNTRGELRRWFGMHEEQFKTNSRVLSVMPGALWHLKETKRIFIARYERDLDRLSALLDEYCGRLQGKQNEQQIDPVHLDLIREKIDGVYQGLQDHGLSSQAAELKPALIENHPIPVPGQCLQSNVVDERVIKKEEPVFDADLSSTEVRHFQSLKLLLKTQHSR